MSADEVADDMLRSFFERWQRLEEEKAAISDDLREMFAEAKGNGFDTKAMRAVFRDMTKDSTDREEAEAIYDLYWSSLNGLRARPAPAHVEIFEEIPPHDADTGELAEKESPSTGHVSPSARNHHQGGGSANIGGDHVNPGDDTNTDGNAPVQKGKASSAGHEGEQAPAPIPPTDPYADLDIPEFLRRSPEPRKSEHA